MNFAFFREIPEKTLTEVNRMQTKNPVFFFIKGPQKKTQHAREVKNEKISLSLSFSALVWVCAGVFVGRGQLKSTIKGHGKTII